MFGTYQKEEEQVVYGITTNIENKANPIAINFHEYVDMWNDIRSTRSLKRKFFFLFGNPIDVAREKKINAVTEKVSNPF
jgi:hypothetical protein